MNNTYEKTIDGKILIKTELDTDAISTRIKGFKEEIVFFQKRIESNFQKIDTLIEQISVIKTETGVEIEVPIVADLVEKQNNDII